MIKLVIGLPLAVVSFILYAQLVVGKGKDFAESMAITGAFGDSFGMVTAFASGLAAYLVYKTLVAQKTELDLTRGELQDTRAQQNLHAIENTFYKLVELHHSNMVSLTHSQGGGRTTVGRSTVTGAKNDIDRKYKQLVTELNSSGEVIMNVRGGPNYFESIHLLSDEQQEELLEGVIRIVDWSLDAPLNTYVNQLVTILEYLEKHSDILKTQKDLFIDILRAQLSIDELKWLFYVSYLSDRPELDILKVSSLLNRLSPDDFMFNIKDFRVADLPLRPQVQS